MALRRAMHVRTVRIAILRIVRMVRDRLLSNALVLFA
jgi:hypothetical protein